MPRRRKGRRNPGVEKHGKLRCGARVRLVECGALVSESRPSQRAGSHLQWASTPTGQWMRVFSTTAIAPNRQRDKLFGSPLEAFLLLRSRVENSLGLPEFGDAWTEPLATSSERGVAEVL